MSRHRAEAEAIDRPSNTQKSLQFDNAMRAINGVNCGSDDQSTNVQRA